MDTIFRGDLATRRGRANAWADSLLVDHGALRLLWTNQAAVAPGRLYRSNHPTPGRLAALARRFGIRSIVNLRGLCANGSDALSRAQAARLGLAFFDAPVSSGQAPSRARALDLAQTLLRAPQPVLVHCKSGADRAGLAAGMFLLLHGGDTRAALGQLSWRFGHLRNSRAGVLDAFFRAFALEAEGRRPFLAWLSEEYDPQRLASARTAGPLSELLHVRALRRE